jgi:hypothetical protein
MCNPRMLQLLLDGRCWGCCSHAGVVFDMKQSRYKKLGKLLDKFAKDKARFLFLNGSKFRIAGC